MFLVLVVLIFFAGSIPLPQSINCLCRVEPVEIWYLKQDGVGQISTGWQRNLLGTTEEKTLRQFDRPDVVEVQLSPRLREGAEVQKGDTVAVITSFSGVGQLRALEALHNKAIAEHAALAAGARLEDQEVAYQQMLLAETALEAYTPEYERVKRLYEKGHISQAEWQLTYGQYMVLKVELEFARAQHAASRVGARPEDITVAQAEIKRIDQLIQNEINSLNSLEVIFAPVSGIVRLGEESGSVLLIERIDTLVVVIAIPELAAGKLKARQPVEISLLADSVSSRSSVIEQMDFRGVSTSTGLGYALLENKGKKLKCGMDGFAKLPLGEITIWEGIKIKLHDFRI